MSKEEKNNAQLREEAVQILYDSLKSKHKITKDECYEVYDKLKKARGGTNLEHQN